MCGIFGIKNLTNSAQPFNKQKFTKGLEVIEHRGPDAMGITMPNDNILLGHRRLSIIDLSVTNNQPFVADDYLHLIYNGEIYNYLELKNELVQLGYSFLTEGDTEVLIRAYQAWGFDCVKKFNGMWSFALYDTNSDTLFCSRDRFGVKPFNYAIHNNQFFFASEIKSILAYEPTLKQPNYNVIANFCRNSIGAQITETWFKNILRLPPAHNLIVKNGAFNIQRYWSYPTKTNNNISFEAAKQQYTNLFTDAIKLRMRSDVPVGTTLSSGLDSSAIVSALRTFFKEEHHTYTATFKNEEFQQYEKNNFKENVEINEGQIVSRLANNLKLTANFIELRDTDFINNLKLVLFHLESGHSSPATMPLYKVMQRAHKDVKVVLEGQGADELLGGYISNDFFFFLFENIKKGKFVTAWKEWQSFRKTYSTLTSLKLYVRLLNNKIIQDFFSLINGTKAVFGEKIKQYKLITPENEKQGPAFDNGFNRTLFKQHVGGLVNLLHYGDAISMAHSIESRLPFMDYRLVEFAFTLPHSFKIKNGLSKYLHRKSIEEFVPDFIVNNPLKFGFTTPLSKHFLQSENSQALSILTSDKCLSRGIFNKQGLEKIINAHQSKKADHSRFLFRLLSVELWFQIFIDEE